MSAGQHVVHAFPLSAKDCVTCEGRLPQPRMDERYENSHTESSVDLNNVCISLAKTVIPVAVSAHKWT